MEYTFENIEKEGLLLYRYLRGSHCHGINTPTSDEDYGGVFIAPLNDTIDLGFNYVGQVNDEKNDNVWYELRKFMTLLIKSNPTVLESLFVADKYVTFEHPLMTYIKGHRNDFLTKKCFDSFYRYAESQIAKAKGLNKMINWEKDKVTRKGILDFTYTFYNQGSTKINNWLEYRGLKQEYCGLVNIPNMRDIYGVYYDWGRFFQEEGITLSDIRKAYKDGVMYNTIELVNKIKESDSEELKGELKKAQLKNMVRFIEHFYGLNDPLLDDFTEDELIFWYNRQKPIGYRGMVGENSQQLRLSSVEKNERPICHVSYNKDGYVKHCIDYRNYKDWEAHRNPVRYESNLKKSYDAKNMCECFRLVNCGIEIANGDGYKVDRSGIDAEFLLNVKNHKYEYDELIEMLNEKKKVMEEAMANSTLPEDIDIELVNNIYLTIRNDFKNGVL